MRKKQAKALFCEWKDAHVFFSIIYNLTYLITISEEISSFCRLLGTLDIVENTNACLISTFSNLVLFVCIENTISRIVSHAYRRP